MGLTDKILLGLLVILLPLGIVVSRQVFSPSSEEVSDERTAQLSKIETLLDELAQQDDGASSPPPIQQAAGLQLDSVSFASSSGILTIRGSKAKPNMMVRIFVVEYQQESNAVQNSAVANVKALGKPVVVQAVEPLTDGSFVYEYLPDTSLGQVDVTVEQNGGSDTLGYKLETNTILYQSE